MFDEQADVLEDTQKRRAISNKMVLPASAPLSDPYATQFVQEEDPLTLEHEQQTVAMPNDWQQLPMTPIVPFNTSYKATVGASLRSRPAYRIAMLGLVLLVLVGIVGTLAFNAFAQSGSIANKGRSVPIIMANSTPGGTQKGTATAKKVTPGGVVGTLNKLPTATATSGVVQQPATSSGGLTLQIAWYPQSVTNNTTVPITILASQSNAHVQLIVTYEAPPGFFASYSTDTNNDAMAILQWHIRVFSHRHGVIARMIAVARNDQGNIARSQMVTIVVNADR